MIVEVDDRVQTAILPYWFLLNDHFDQTFIILIRWEILNVKKMLNNTTVGREGQSNVNKIPPPVVVFKESEDRKSVV